MRTGSSWFNILCQVTLCIALCSSVTAGQADRFTVADSIAMTRIVDPDVTLARYKGITFRLSPRGDKFAIVTKRGDLAADQQVYSLLLFDVEQVRTFLRGQASALPAPTELATFASPSNEHAIDEVKWMSDGRTLAFIGRGRDEIGQVYALDTASEKLTQLTHSPHNVATFDLAWAAQVLVYSAYLPPDWRARSQNGYAVRSDYVATLWTKDQAQAVPEVRHFVRDLEANRTQEIRAPAGTMPRDVSVSPDGRWAVLLIQVSRIPERWSQYEFMRRHLSLAAHTREVDVTDGTQEYLDDEAFGRPTPALSQFFLADLKEGEATPALDAPSRAGWASAAAWSQDSSRVILAPTFMPLAGGFSEDIVRRRREEAVIELLITPDRKVRYIADAHELEAKNGERRTFMGAAWATNSNVSVTRRAAGAPLRTTIYSELKGKWTVGTADAAVSRLELGIEQRPDLAPEVVVRDVITGAQRPITDLNPQLRSKALGRVKTFSWRDRLGRKFSGGLVLPPHFDSVRRYPVVLQTYGYDPAEFLVDGPDGKTTAYAARALAAKDIIVLQLPVEPAEQPVSNLPSRWEDRGENPLFQAMLEAAIDALDSAALIDRNRVGVIGFSREGMHVHHTITFSSYPIAAATIADSIAATPLGYVLAYGQSYLGMLEWESDSYIGMGAPFWGEGIDLWVARSPVFHLDRIRTPLRIETLGSYFNPYWETFAILKRHYKPVELVHIPFASHVIQRPQARYASQQGNVDWFCFWLKGEENSDPAKADQYARWRKLRKHHHAKEQVKGAPNSPSM